jgi:hypothetical protein
MWWKKAKRRRGSTLNSLGGGKELARKKVDKLVKKSE